nr:alcohol dehydrogenase catalytic domain-containing protein [Actinomycetota bacterium]
MGELSLAAVAVGGKRVELQEFPLPEPLDTGGLLRVEACGVCGSDIKKYGASPMLPTILGHESVGRIARVGETAARRWGVSEGDRVLLEEYLPCGHCVDCRSGEFRSCNQTDNHLQSGAIRYGSTPVEVPPALWGGYSEYQYLHPSSVIHRVPDGVPAEQAAFALPLSNGIQWTQLDAGVRMGDVVVILGPGQQGIGCLIASKAAGAGRVIVSGLSRDRARLELARELGADRVVDVDVESLVE